MDYQPMKKALAAAFAVIAMGAPAMAGSTGTLNTVRTYAETGTRTVSTIGTENSASYSLDSAASGTGASAVSTGSFTNGGNVTITGSASATSVTTGVTASATGSAAQMDAAAYSNVLASTFTDGVVETLTGVFSD